MFSTLGLAKSAVRIWLKMCWSWQIFSGLKVKWNQMLLNHLPIHSGPFFQIIQNSNLFFGRYFGLFFGFVFWTIFLDGYFGRCFWQFFWTIILMIFSDTFLDNWLENFLDCFELGHFSKLFKFFEFEVS